VGGHREKSYEITSMWKVTGSGPIFGGEKDLGEQSYDADVKEDGVTFEAGSRRKKS